MSAEQEIENIISTTQSHISALSSSTHSMVSAATAVLAGNIRFPEPPVEVTPGRWTSPDGLNLTSVSAQPPASFPQWPEVALAPPPATQSLAEIDGDIDAELAALRLPVFSYPTPEAPVDFSKPAPVIRTDWTVPPAPDTAIPPLQALLNLLPITAPNLQPESPQFAAVTTRVALDSALFDTAFATMKNGVLGGVDALLPELRQWSDGALQLLLPLTLEAVAARVGDRYAPVLAAHKQMQGRLEQRLNDERDRVLAATVETSGWELPRNVALALRATAEQVAQAWKAQAVSTSDTHNDEIALALFESCSDLFEQIKSSAMRFKAKELEYVLESHRLAVAYAKQVTNALLAAFEAENFTKQDIAFLDAEARLQAEEAALKVAVLKYEVASARMETEKAQQASDTGKLKKYQADLQKSALDAQRYAAQVGAARSEVELKALPVEMFEARVRAFDAKMDAHQSRIAARTAEIDGDRARVDGELKKVAEYEAKAQGFIEKVSARTTQVGAQTARNEALVAEYRLQARTALFTPEKSALGIDFDLAKYEVQANKMLAEADLALKQARAKLDYADQVQQGSLDALRQTEQIQFHLKSVELNRLQALAKTTLHGAEIMGGMAEGATSAVDAIAGAVVSEA